MTALLIENVETVALDRLRAKAAADGLTLQAEVARILESAASRPVPVQAPTVGLSFLDLEEEPDSVALLEAYMEEWQR